MVTCTLSALNQLEVSEESTEIENRLYSRLFWFYFWRCLVSSHTITGSDMWLILSHFVVGVVVDKTCTSICPIPIWHYVLLYIFITAHAAMKN